jgi:hypothetical protein
MVFFANATCSLFVLQGLILSKALKAQKEAEDESCQIALGNPRLEVIMLRNEGLEKDKILLSLDDKLARLILPPRPKLTRSKLRI